MEPLEDVPETDDEGNDLRQPPDVPDFIIYQTVDPNKTYVCGADPAEGLPSSDDSAATWLDADTGEEVAALCGKIPPDLFAKYITEVSAYYNDAFVLPERNNHGHAVISGLERLGIVCLQGPDQRPGWPQTQAGKTMLYDTYVATVQDAARAGLLLIFDFNLWQQLAAIDRRTLAHPNKKSDTCVDDEATAEVLAETARSMEAFTHRAAFGDDDGATVAADIPREVADDETEPQTEQEKAAAGLWGGLYDLMGDALSY